MPTCQTTFHRRFSPLLAMAGLLASAALQATTWTVDSTSASPALNACTAAPADCSFPGAVSRMAFVGDSIVFTVASSSATEVQIGKDAIIDAAGARLPKLFITTGGVGWATVTVRNARFENLDGSIYPGGAIQISRQQIVTIEDSVFLNNRSNANGGAIHNEGTLAVTRSRFEGNFSNGGAGAIHSTNHGSLTVLDSSFRGNGVLDPAGPNRQLGQFGAISAESTLDIRGSLFHENESNYASAVRSAVLTRIYNSTFVDNRTFAATESGALLLGGPARIANCTIVGNSGTTSGGLFVYPASDTQVINTIIANNTGASPEIGGRIYSHGNNLIRDRTGAQVDGNVASTDIYATDPRLAPLGNYGGPTMTLLLTPESPALNAGADCVLSVSGCYDFPHVALSNDQRGPGFARSRGGAVDIGAFELGSVVVNNNQDSGAGSLRQAISDALPGDVVSFSPAYFNQPRTIALASTLVVNKSMSIIGPGAHLLTLDAGNQRRHLNVDAPATLNLRGMRFTNGNPGTNVSGGAILVNLGTLSASEITIDNSTGLVGGCLYNNGTLTLARARLSGCRAANAAGLFNEAGKSATISDTRIENNVATGPAGGIANPGGGTLAMTNVSLSGNQATIGGGLNSYGTATISNSTFSGNTADNGGAMYLGGTGTTTLTHATITANTAQYNGGVGAEFDAVVNLQGTLIAGNTRTVDQAPDAGGNFTSFGHNLIGSTIGTTFRPSSPSLVGNIVGASARLAALADNGGYSLTHAPLHNSQAIDGAGSGASVDGRGLPRPIDFTTLVNAAGGNGSDIGAYEIQVATPTNVVATPMAGGLSISFNGSADGGPAVTSYQVICGAQSVTGTASPILVTGLPIGVAVSCTVTARSNALTGIPSAPSNSAAPASLPGAPVIGTAVAGNGQVSVVFTAPTSDGGSAITGYTATCGNRSANGGASPISVIGLINGAATSCSVTATNVVGSGPDSAASNSVTPGLPGAFAYIPRVGQASVAVVNLDTGAVVQDIGLTSGNSGVATSPDGARVYVIGNSGVSVINTQTRSHVATIPVGSSPWSAVVSPDSTRIYVSNRGDSTVSVIDAASNQVVATIPVFNQPYGIAITPDGSRLYVANGGSRAASVIDTATLQVIDTLTVGMDPIGVATSPDGRHAYVTGQTSNDVSVIDVQSGSVVATVTVGSSAYGVIVSRDSRHVYVGNANGNSVSVIDARTRAVIATVAVGARPEGIDVSADGSEVLVVNRDSGSISRISTATNAVVGSIGLNGGLPFAMGRFVSLGGRVPAFTGSPPDGLLGVPYHYALNVSGTPAASFVLASGALPPGLSLDGAFITGTPTAVGTGSGSIRASNGVADAASQPFEITISATVPGAPTITGVTRGNASVEVGFSAPGSNGGSAITGYTATCGTQSLSGTDSPIVVSGLTNGVAVTCTVIATNAVGNSLPSASSASVTPATVPDAPTGVIATRGNALVSVAFAVPASDGGSAITGYAASCGAQSQSGPESPLIVGGLTNGTPVSCTVVAINDAGDSVPSAASNTVTPAAVPGAPVITTTTPADASVTVAFSAPAQTGGEAIIDYLLSCTPGSASVGGQASPLTLAGLANGVVHACVVSARNAVGSGPSSLPVAVIPDAVSTANLGISLSNGTDFVSGGSDVTYTITVTNVGPAGVTDARVENALDPAFSAAHWQCVGADGAICAPSGLGDLDQRVVLPAGSSVQFLLTATLAALPETPVSNIASVTPPAAITDPALNDNVASDGPDHRGLLRDGFE